MKLYGAVLSPFVRMCLVTAHELGLKDKLTHVPASVSPIAINPDLAKLSPIGKIPVLETDHSHAIYDSRVIMEYLAHVGGSRSFIPDDGVKRFRVLTLLALAQGIAEAAVALRYEQAQRPENARWPDFMERQKARINDGLNEIENHWLDALEAVSAGSVAIACAIGYIDLRHADLNWRKTRPHAALHLDAFANRPSMQAWPVA